MFLSDSTPYRNEIVNSVLVVFPNVPLYPLHGSRDGDELGILEGSPLGWRLGDKEGSRDGCSDGYFAKRKNLLIS